MKKHKVVQIRDPVLLCGACYWLLARDATGLLRMGLWAALLHESGHIAAWVLLVHRLPQIRVGLGGLCLQRQQEELSGLRLLGSDVIESIEASGLDVRFCGGADDR